MRLADRKPSNLRINGPQHRPARPGWDHHCREIRDRDRRGRGRLRDRLPRDAHGLEAARRGQSVQSTRRRPRPGPRKAPRTNFIQEAPCSPDLSERSRPRSARRATSACSRKSRRADSIPYMVLEWLDGAPLEGVIEHERQQGLPLRSLEDTRRSCASSTRPPKALALALAQRDRPSRREARQRLRSRPSRAANTRSVKLLDFGIAKVIARTLQKMEGAFGKTTRATSPRSRLPTARPSSSIVPTARPAPGPTCSRSRSFAVRSPHRQGPTRRRDDLVTARVSRRPIQTSARPRSRQGAR